MRVLPEFVSLTWAAYPLSFVKEARAERIRKHLTFSNPAYYEGLKRGYNVSDMPTELTAYREMEEWLFLPRNFEFHAFGLPKPTQIFPNLSGPPEVLWKGLLRDYQEPAFASLTQRLGDDLDGIFSLSCGKGKTVLAVAAWATVHKGPGLAVCTTIDIVKQWKEALLTFTTIKEDQIGIIGDGSKTWKGKHFVVATLQSLAKIDFPPAFYQRFGVVYFDECHRLGAPYFSKVAPRFYGTRIGLSATWQRQDKLEQMFCSHIGPVFYEDHEQQLIPEIHFMQSPVTLDLRGYRLFRRRELNFAKIINKLASNAPRLAWIGEHIALLYAQSRKVLILGDRINELQSLQEILPTLGVDPADVGLCVGSLDGRALSSDERRRALSARVILATAQLVKEGLDKKDIDSLVILYPKSNAAFAEQAAGRILRIADGKQTPQVFVVEDYGAFLETGYGTNRPFSYSCSKMQDTFKRLGYLIIAPVKGIKS